MKPGVLAGARVFDQVLIPKSMLRPAIAPGSLQQVFFLGKPWAGYPLVNVYITMERSTLFMEKSSIFLWPFSLVFCMFTRPAISHRAEICGTWTGRFVQSCLRLEYHDLLSLFLQQQDEGVWYVACVWCPYLLILCWCGWWLQAHVFAVSEGILPDVFLGWFPTTHREDPRRHPPTVPGKGMLRH